ncbi:MAG TPA: S1/P1 nuclease [Gemmatimonadales bacterium]|nr:S1/P1 nuclease [Gemmatimonadales bacterium]
MRLALLLLLAVIPVHPTPHDTEGRVWYDMGHRLIARIAESRLTPHTADAVRSILAGQSLAAASTWADDIKNQRPQTKPAHFVNIPLEATSYDPATSKCGTGRCIIPEIEKDRQALMDSGSTDVERTEALRFLIHLIGDLHQPLHVADQGDHGGNDRNVMVQGQWYKLHAVWDGELLKTRGLSEDAYYQRLKREMDSLNLAAFEQGSVIDWAMEGHTIAKEHAYHIPKGSHLGDAYIQENLPLIDLALIKAGVRLAKVLNETLAHYQPAPSPTSTLGPQVYTDREAAAHVGETATVVGTVVSVHRVKSGNIYLNFGADYPHQTFSGAILNPRDPSFNQLDSLAGKRVGVKGTIKNYKGQAEIVIEKIDQIILQPGPTPLSPAPSRRSGRLRRLLGRGNGVRQNILIPTNSTAL